MTKNKAKQATMMARYKPALLTILSLLSSFYVPAASSAAFLSSSKVAHQKRAAVVVRTPSQQQNFGFGHAAVPRTALFSTLEEAKSVASGKFFFFFA